MARQPPPVLWSMEARQAEGRPCHLSAPQWAGRVRGGDAREAPTGPGVPAGTSVRLCCCPSHGCHHLTPLPSLPQGTLSPGGCQVQEGLGHASSLSGPPGMDVGSGGQKRLQTEKDKAQLRRLWNPPSVAPRTFPGCLSRLLPPFS